jgi:hypothetical protein
MGSRDYRKAEKKKPKKSAKKVIPPTTILSTPAEVQVIRKGKKEPEPED